MKLYIDWWCFTHWSPMRDSSICRFAAKVDLNKFDCLGSVMLTGEGWTEPSRNI